MDSLSLSKEEGKHYNYAMTQPAQHMGFLTKSRSNIWTTLESYFRKIGRKCAFWPPKYWPRYGEKTALGRRERERERTLQYVVDTNQITPSSPGWIFSRGGRGSATNMGEEGYHNNPSTTNETGNGKDYYEVTRYERKIRYNRGKLNCTTEST